MLVGFDVNLGEGAPERVEDPLVVCLAERLEHDLDAHLVDAREEPGALVEDVLDRGALLVDEPRQLGDPARPVAHRRDEAHEPPVGGEAALDDAAEHRRVDVAAAERHEHLLALEVGPVEGPAREERREACGAAALDDELLELDQPEHRERDVALVDLHHLVHVLARDGEGVRPDGRHREPVGQRGRHVDRHRRARLERGREGGAPLGLDADDADLRVERLDGERDTRDQPRAAHGHDDRVDVGRALQHLDAQRARARDDLLPRGEVGPQ